MPNTQQGRPINVSLRVIADLSQGLYRSPADALKELINNAYDADSPKVEVYFRDDFNTLIVKDYGKGMSTDDFIGVMETIGGSSKRSADSDFRETTPSGRKIVGRIGIGMLSVSQIANKLEVQSTTKGSQIGFNAQIEFDQFASEEARKIRITDLWEADEQVRLGNYFIKERTGIDEDRSFTTLKLTGIKHVIAEKLRGKEEKDGYERKMGVEFSTIEQLIKWMREEERGGVNKTALHEYDRLFWELCMLCPVPYLDGAIKVVNHLEDKTSTEEEFNDFANRINRETHLELRFDDLLCKKPILMPHDLDKDYHLFFNLLFMKGFNGRVIKYNDYDEGGNPIQRELKVNGYFYFQRPKITPPELQGILIRVRNVAVGHYDSTFLTYKRHEGFKFSQVTGEVYVDDLDRALNIDRSSFRETEPSYLAFKEAIHNYLKKTVFPGIKEYATQERYQRAEESSMNEATMLQDNFDIIDDEGLTIELGGDQPKLVVRENGKVIIATSIDRRKTKLSKEIHRVIAFMEAKLKEEIDEEHRDELYDSLRKWLSNFD